MNIVELSELGRTVTGKTPLSSNHGDFGDRYCFVTPTDSLQLKFVDKTDRSLSQVGVDRLKGKLLPPRSVLVSCIGSAMGKVVMNRRPCVTNQQFNSIVVNEEHYLPDYIYYALKNNYRMLRNAATGSTATPILNKTDFDQLKLRIHANKDEQVKVANILSAIDDKIELNTWINEELEGITKLLYDYWFVQFDFPMTAAQATGLGNPKLEGKPYRTSGGKMIYNETLKSDIPVGWNCQKLVDLEPQIVTGKTPPTTDSNNFGGPIPFICIGDVRGNMNILKTELTLTEKGANLQKNKFIPKGSLCVTCIASPGLLGFATCDSQTNQQLNSVVFSDEVNRYFLFFYLGDYFKYSSGAKSGNTFANMNKGEFEAINILTPDRTIRDEFTRRVDPMFSSALNNAEQNQELTQLRDWLLPMLMNGQVTVN